MSETSFEAQLAAAAVEEEIAQNESAPVADTESAPTVADVPAISAAEDSTSDHAESSDVDSSEEQKMIRWLSSAEHFVLHLEIGMWCTRMPGMKIVFVQI